MSQEPERVDKGQTTEELLRRNVAATEELVRIHKSSLRWHRTSFVLKFFLLTGVLAWGVFKLGPWVEEIWRVWKDVLLFPSVM